MRNHLLFALGMTLSFSPFALSGTLNMDVPNIHELDQGACWWQSTEDANWKIASFNDHSSGVLSAELIKLNLFARIETELKKMGVANFAETSYAIHFYCSGAGHEILLNIPHPEHPVCVTTNLNFTRFELDANFSDSPSDLCVRGAPAELILTPRDNAHPLEISNWLLKSEHKEVIQKIEVGDYWIVIKLHPAWAFRETAIIQEWKADAELMKITAHIRPNEKISIAGESTMLGIGEFPGFSTDPVKF